MLDIQNLSIQKEGKKIISNISLKIDSGDFVMLSGINGVGKSTILKALLQMADYSGSLKYNQLEIKAIPKSDLVHNIKIIFQSSEDYFFTNSIREEFNFLHPHQITDSEISAILKTFDLAKNLEDSPSEMSGGEKQRLAIAIATHQNPKILILDETLAMLDRETKSQVIKHLTKLNNQGMTILIISHDLQDALAVNKIIWLEKENTIEFPVAHLMVNQEKLSQLFFTTPQMWEDIKNDQTQ